MAIHSMGSIGEALPELEGGHHESLGEFESEIHEHHEGEAEAEQFFGSLARLAARAVQSPTFRRIAATAARSALSGLGAMVSGSDSESLREDEFEAEALHEDELSPIRRVYPDAMMEHHGMAAAEAESEAEARAHVRALVPLAARAVPRAAPVIRRAAPALSRGAAGVLHTLRRNPATRPLVRVIPSIVRGTALTLARQVAAGRPVTPQGAVRLLARQTARVLANPGLAVQAYQRSRVLDRRLHTIAGSSPATFRYGQGPRYYRGPRRRYAMGIPSGPGGGVPTYRTAPRSYQGGVGFPWGPLNSLGGQTAPAGGVPIYGPSTGGTPGMPADLIRAGLRPVRAARSRGCGCGCCCCRCRGR